VRCINLRFECRRSVGCTNADSSREAQCPGATASSGHSMRSRRRGREAVWRASARRHERPGSIASQRKSARPAPCVRPGWRVLSRSRGRPSSSVCAPFRLRCGWLATGDARGDTSIAQSSSQTGCKSVSIWRQRVKPFFARAARRHTADACCAISVPADRRDALRCCAPGRSGSDARSRGAGRVPRDARRRRVRARRA